MPDGQVCLQGFILHVNPGEGDKSHNNRRYPNSTQCFDDCLLFYQAMSHWPDYRQVFLGCRSEDMIAGRYCSQIVENADQKHQVKLQLRRGDDRCERHEDEDWNVYNPSGKIAYSQAEKDVVWPCTKLFSFCKQNENQPVCDDNQYHNRKELSDSLSINLVRIDAACLDTCTVVI